MQTKTVKFLTYKAINNNLVSVLRSGGYEVYYASAADSSITENDISQLANKEGYILMTGDESFGEKMHSEGRVQAGIISLRVKENDEALYAQTVLNAVQAHTGNLPNAYSVITNKDVKSKKFTGV